MSRFCCRLKCCGGGDVVLSKLLSAHGTGSTAAAGGDGRLAGDADEKEFVVASPAERVLTGGGDWGGDEIVAECAL